MAIEKIDSERCVGCGQCIEVCYADVLRMDEGSGQADVAYPQDCAMCCWCLALCPENAIVMAPEKTSPIFTSWG